MAIVKTITDEYFFWNWLKKSDSYKNSFSLQGAKALQEYMDDLSESLDEPLEFDPIAWCVEFTEYESFVAFQNDTGYFYDGVKRWGYDSINNLDDLRDNTTVIEFDGGIIVQDF